MQSTPLDMKKGDQIRLDMADGEARQVTLSFDDGTRIVFVTDRLATFHVGTVRFDITLNDAPPMDDQRSATRPALTVIEGGRS